MKTIVISFCVLLAFSLLRAQEAPPNNLGVRTFVSPDYPIVARQARIQGDVDLNVTIDSTGQIVSVDSVSGPEALVSYAKANIVRWTYTPIGKVLKLKVIYTYRLEKPEMEFRPTPRIELISPIHVLITSNFPIVAG